MDAYEELIYNFLLSKLKWDKCISDTVIESVSSCYKPPADHEPLLEQESIQKTNITSLWSRCTSLLNSPMAFKTALHRPCLKINITLMTPCTCLLNSSEKLAEWTEALNSVSLSLLWQLLWGTEKHVFFLYLSIEKPFILLFLLISFCLNLGDSIFSSLWAKLMAVQELIVRACVWLPDGEWMRIRLRSGFIMTCFFSGAWKWRRGHWRVLNMGVNWSSTVALKPVSIQHPTKEKNHFTHQRRWHIQWELLLHRNFVRWQFLKTLDTQIPCIGLHERIAWHSKNNHRPVDFQK